MPQPEDTSKMQPHYSSSLTLSTATHEHAVATVTAYIHININIWHSEAPSIYIFHAESTNTTACVLIPYLLPVAYSLAPERYFSLIETAKPFICATYLHLCCMSCPQVSSGLFLFCLVLWCLGRSCPGEPLCW